MLIDKKCNYNNIRFVFIRIFDFPFGGAAQNRLLGICKSLSIAGVKTEVHVIGPSRLDIAENKRKKWIFNDIIIINHAAGYTFSRNKLKNLLSIMWVGFRTVLYLKNHLNEGKTNFVMLNTRNIVLLLIVYLVSRLKKWHFGRDLSEYPPYILSHTFYSKLASRCLPFIEQIKSGKPITITDPTMTRYLMSLEEAVELVVYAYQHGVQGDIFVQKSPASTVIDMQALVEMFDAKTEIKIIGTRHGEKKHETLVNREEMAKAVDLPGYYRIPADTRDLNYEKYFSNGEAKVAEAVDYTSENTYRLTIPEIKEKLLTLRYVRDELGME